MVLEWDWLCLSCYIGNLRTENPQSHSFGNAFKIAFLLMWFICIYFSKSLCVEDEGAEVFIAGFGSSSFRIAIMVLLIVS